MFINVVIVVVVVVVAVVVVYIVIVVAGVLYLRLYSDGAEEESTIDDLFLMAAKC